jgi:hypothetical protein
VVKAPVRERLAGNGAGRAMLIGAGSWAASTAGLALVGALATLL